MSRSLSALAIVILLGVSGMCTTSGARAQDNPVQPLSLFNEIQRYAVLADAAYEPQSDIKNAVAAYGYTLVQSGNLPGLEVTYYLATDDVNHRHLLAVRGTTNIENALVDIDIQLVDDSETGIRLHRGFAAAAKGIFDDLKGKINKDYKIMTTGHSLGGAVALILAMYLDNKNYTIEKVVTFGQPKVTNIMGAQKFSHLDVWRVVTVRDLVPVVPPLDPMDIKNLDIYWHLGQEIILLGGTKYSITSGLQSMMRAAGFFNQQLNQDNLQYHKMASYRSLIERKQHDAQWVPYKNEFDIFSIFGDKDKSKDESKGE